MHRPLSTRERDPMALCALFAAGFWVLVALNLAIPTTPYFDEIHYLPAARELLAMGTWTNREHPMVGKEVLALGIAVFGDNSWGWRIMPSLAGALTLFALMRALWFATLSRFAVLAYGLLLVTGFHLFVHSRIAMLDQFMVAFLALAWWQIAAALREPETGRRRLAAAGVATGLALGAKWNAIPLAILPGLAFLVLRWRAGRRHLLTSRRGPPVPGVTLLEAGVWLGLVPLATYALTFFPALFFAEFPLGRDPLAVVRHQKYMLDLQESVIKPHPYMSQWWDWIINRRSIWYLWEVVDGARRGVLLIGNPVTMLLGLPAVVWCAWAGFARGNRAALGVFWIYAFALGFWIVAAKPVQFYYHYYVPSCALLAALALALDAAWRAGWRHRVRAVLIAALAVFAYYFPILSALPVGGGKRGFEAWTVLSSWI